MANLAKDLILPDLKNPNNTTNEAYPAKSKVSGISQITKYNALVNNRQSISSDNELEDFELLSNKNCRSIDRVDFPNEQDEWNAIVKYNHKLYEEEKKNNKLKDLEIKKRTREDLDNQIRQKLKHKYEEMQKNREYDNIILSHCQFMDEVERKRNQEAKDRLMKEKENRDKQLLDEQTRKKIEILKEKKYDREYVKNIQSEMEKDKQMQLKRRQDDKNLMLKTIEESKLNRLRMLENREHEKLNDIKAVEDLGKLLDRQEMERKEYFKKIERNANNFVNRMAATVMNEIKIKSKEEDEKMNAYLLEREKRLK